MSTALIPQNMIVEVGSEETVKELSRASNYIPSIRVFDGSSKQCKKGTVGAGHLALALGNDKFLELGKEQAVLNIGFRCRASIFQGESKPIDFFDEESDEFKEITAKAHAGVKGYNSGLEFLVYIPSCDKFACFYLGNKSGRYVCDDMKSTVGGAALIRSKFVEKPDNSWHCAEILECNTPFELPEKERILEAVATFKSSMVQADAPKDEETGRER